jgi:hypothetical protein
LPIRSSISHCSRRTGPAIRRNNHRPRHAASAMVSRHQPQR